MIGSPVLVNSRAGILLLLGFSVLACRDITRELGPLVEAKYWPVYQNWSIVDVERTETRFCWTVLFDKLRPVAAEEISYRLTDSDGNSQAFIPLLDDGFPINSVAARNAVGKGQKSRRCVNLPKWVANGETIVITGSFSFRGFMNLWKTSWDTGVIKNP